jgi:hypothetical protein
MAIKDSEKYYKEQYSVSSENPSGANATAMFAANKPPITFGGGLGTAGSASICFEQAPCSSQPASGGICIDTVGTIGVVLVPDTLVLLAVLMPQVLLVN